MMRALALFILIGVSLSTAEAQWRQTPPSSVLLHDLRKLRTTSSALYLAAHPDDENTRLIAYLANDRLAETAYLSLTRGDGGQNLIGPELREGLGVIRTQELLAARRTDGGTQFFTRANDYGFSKHPDEAFTFWTRDSILADVVWTIRKWQPDVIVARFDPNSAGQTHGHHTASAMLAVEGFRAAADPRRFPEQLVAGVAVWQAKRVLFNTSWWFYGSQEAFDAADKSNLFTVDAGGFYPLLGLSNGEIAARSRSQHASQGFGSSGQRGSSMEYLQLLDGATDEDRTDLFAGVDQTWGRVAGGAAVERVLAKAEDKFRVGEPAAILPELIEALRLVRALPHGRYRDSKLPALQQLIADVMGVYVETTATDSLATPGQTIGLEYEAVVRKGLPETTRLQSVRFAGGGDTVEVAVLDALKVNEGLSGKARLRVGQRTSSPYWLAGEATEGMYAVPGYDLRGLGENPPAATAQFSFTVDGQVVELTTPVLYKKTYPDRGEIYRPLAVVPAVSVGFTEPVYLWADAMPRDIDVEVEHLAGDTQSGDVTLVLPKGWTAAPAKHSVSLAAGTPAQTLRFRVTPVAAAGEFSLSAKLTTAAGQTFDQQVELVRYPHIPLQVMVAGAGAKAVRLDLKRAGKKVGYVMGAGDAVPEALRAVGYEVDMLDQADIRAAKLADYDAVVLGIRAYNTLDWLPGVNDQLLDYVKAGGTMVVQYNTNRGLDMDKLAPFPLSLSRDRVTVEQAPMKFVDAKASVLTTPNRLGAADFEGWVQERGLYFPGKWDAAYAPVFEVQDPGEAPTRGSLLVAEYGKGHYVYTGLSFFRELPAGVPGAYRLFVNLLEL